MRLLDWLGQGPFSLVLSSGFFGFYAHCGFLRALERAGLSPAAVAGSSAGSLVGGMWAAGRSSGDIGEELLGLRRSDFWDPGFGAGLLRGARFGARLREGLSVRRFEETRAPLAVSIWDVRSRRTRVITHGDLAPAIQASCTFPGLFQPVRVEGRLALDGGIADRSAMDALDALDASVRPRVFHHHLASRSPWRRRSDPALRPPSRNGLQAIVVEGLPRCGPFRMERGGAAMDAAFEATLQALDQPIDEGGPGRAFFLPGPT